MKYIYKIRLTFFLILTIIFTTQSFIKPQTNKNSFLVRVLLEEKNSLKKTFFKIEAENGIILTSPHSNKKFFTKQDKIKIFIEDNNIYIPLLNKKSNQIKIKKIKSKELKITSINDFIKINNNTYQGNLKFKIEEKNNNYLIINTLSLEDYVYYVLPSEIYPSWPEEMRKVQAVVSRSYALYYINQVKKNKNNQKPYDLKRNNFHQTYNGFHEYYYLKKAIEDTKDMILIYNGQIALTMFDACCGGIVTSKMSNINFSKAPYLARDYTCNFCKNYKLYKWKKIIPETIFLNILKNDQKFKNKFKNCGKLKKVYVAKKDKSGITQKIRIVFSKKIISISGNDLWESMKNKIKSLSFQIKKSGNKIIIEGKGFGHQIGLCQRGARLLVDWGWKFKNILKFYYPNTKFARLKHA